MEKILTNLKPPNKPNTNLKDKIEFLKQASEYFITLAGIVIKENSVFISCTFPGLVSIICGFELVWYS